MLGIAFLCNNLQGLFLGTNRSRINPDRLEIIAMKHMAIIVFIIQTPLLVIQLSISEKQVKVQKALSADLAWKFELYILNNQNCHLQWKRSHLITSAIHSLSIKVTIILILKSSLFSKSNWNITLLSHLKMNRRNV